MCGFTAVFSRNKNFLSHINLTKVSNLQHHRGPDAKGYIAEKNGFMFHNRLKIIDISNKSNQPFVSKLTGNAIIFNGEIYNYKELRKILQNRKFYTNSDTETIIYLYEKYGDKFIDKLNGIFSFIILDKKRNLLFSARDRFGVKPLYYFMDKEKIIYSTEIKSIIAINKYHSLNFNEIKNYISSGLLYENKNTFFKNIFRSEQACYSKFCLTNYKLINKIKYWLLKKDNSLKCKSHSEFNEGFEHQLGMSLKLNLVSNVDVGILLSSGSDSNLIYQYLKNKFNLNPKTFTYGWRANKYNEVLKLQQLHKSTENFNSTICDPNKILNDLNNIIYMCEGPVGGFGTYGIYCLMELIKKNNIKVVLSGEGSDEFLLGYHNMHILFIRELYYTNRSLFKNELNKFLSVEKNTNINERNFINYSNRFLKNEIYTPDGKSMKDADLVIKTNIKKVNNHISLNALIKSYAFKTKLPKLLTFLDKCSGAFGVESRVPMLDHNLVSFVYSNDHCHKFADGIAKKPIKDLLSRDKVKYNDTKLHVSTPQREFFKNKEILNKIRDLISNGNLEKSGIFNKKNFFKKYDNYIKEKNLGNSFFIWKVLNTEFFLKNFQ